MTTAIPEADSTRVVTLDDAPHAPGSVFLTTYASEWHRARGRAAHTVELDRATLIVALRGKFGLIDPLELALNE